MDFPRLLNHSNTNRAKVSESDFFFSLYLINNNSVCFSTHFKTFKMLIGTVLYKFRNIFKKKTEYVNFWASTIKKLEYVNFEQTT